MQYGLEALKKGSITTEQFVDLNDKIGGGDIDSDPTPERFQADQPALAQRLPQRRGSTARTTSTSVAIIDLRGPDPGAFHDAYRSWAIRARLEREHGTFANQVIWFGAVPLMGDPNYADRGDGRDGPVARGGRGRPAAPDRSRRRSSATVPSDVKDRCSQLDGLELVSAPGRRPGLRAEGRPDPVRHAAHGCRRGRRDRHQQVHAQAAAAPATTTRSRSRDDQWQRLQSAFPTGVCDWSVAGVEPGGHDPVADLPGRGAATSSTAAGRSARRRRARAPAGPATRSTPGATDRGLTNFGLRGPHSGPQGAKFARAGSLRMGAALEWSALGAVVQLVERWSPKPEVEGSSPSCPALPSRSYAES